MEVIENTIAIRPLATENNHFFTNLIESLPQLPHDEQDWHGPLATLIFVFGALPIHCKSRCFIENGIQRLTV